MRPLAGMRVVEVAQGIAAPYAGMLLADLGADVLKVETPAGDAARGTPVFHVLNRGKRSAVVDPGGSAGRDRLLRAVGEADVLLLDNEEGRPYEDVLAYERISTASPGLVWCAVPGFPSSSRFRDLPGDEPLMAAASGLMSGQGAADREGPVYLTLPLISYFAGMLAASGAMAGQLVAANTGTGQRIVVPGVAVGAFLVGALGVQSDELPRPPLSPNPWGGTPAYRLYRASDEWLVVACTNPAFFAKLCVAVDRPELVADPRFENAPWGIQPPENREALAGIFTEILATKTRDEWLRILRENDVPSAPICTRGEYLRSELVRTNGATIELDDPQVGRILEMGVPLRIDGVRERPSGPAPELGADTAALVSPWSDSRPARPRRNGAAPKHPFEGLRVLDFTTYLGGPVCGLLLAELGADVIKVEPLDGEGFRSGGLSSIGVNRGKRGLAIDLKTEEGAGILRDLIVRSDVLIEGFRPGAARRIGIDTASLRALNPGIVHCSITGYGDYEPYWSHPSFDPLFQALSGQMQGQGGDGPPVFAGTPQNDFASGFLALFGIASALWRRERTGEGGLVEVFQCDAALSIQAGETAEYGGRPPLIAGGPDLLGTSATQRLFRGADGQWFLLDCRTAEEFARLCGALDGGQALPPEGDALLRDPRGPLGRELEARFAGLPAHTWLRRLEEAGVRAVPAQSVPRDGVANDIFTEMGIVTVMDHRIFGRLTTVTSPLWMEKTPLRVGNPAPWVGEDNRAILAELGLDATAVDRLEQSGVVGTLPGPRLF